MFFWSIDCGGQGSGLVKFVDKLYGYVATVTTIGYGDCSPRSVEGKLFFVVHCLFLFGGFICFFGPWQAVRNYWLSNPKNYDPLTPEDVDRRALQGSSSDGPEFEYDPDQI